MTHKIVLDPGHGGTDLGATFGDLKEANVTLSVATLCRGILEDHQMEVMLTREIDCDVSLTNRTNMANQWRADCFVSIHCNADPDEDAPGMTEAIGSEIWMYPGSTKALRLSKAIERHLRSAMPDEPFRGVKASEYLYVLRHTGMPAVLVEIAFIDNSTSNRKLREEETQVAIAKAIAGGILDYFFIE